MRKKLKESEAHQTPQKRRETILKTQGSFVSDQDHTPTIDKAQNGLAMAFGKRLKIQVEKEVEKASVKREFET